MKYHIALICIIIVSFSCSSNSAYLKYHEIIRVENKSKLDKNCQSWESYVPDTSNLLLTPVRRIRVNFHIVQKADGSGNFTEKEGKLYVKNLLNYANGTLRYKNKKMFLPKDNDTPVLPQRYQYILTPCDTIPEDDGIYCHQDDEVYFMVKAGKNKDYHKRDVIKRYAINDDKVLNVFLLEHHTDSLASPTFRPKDMGIAIGTSVKILGFKTNYDLSVNGKFPFREWFAQKLLNHEIGHVLGLRHSWVSNDRCDDTPPHPNCWNFGAPPCNEVSNNVMDYNAYSDSWTPCQLGLIHKNFSKKGSRQRKLLIEDWCTLKEDATVRIWGSHIWEGAKDLSGHLILHKGSELIIKCRVSLPKDAQIIVKPGAKLIIEDSGEIGNDCGEKWDGIIVEQQGNKKGTVTLRGSALITDVVHRLDKPIP